MKNLKSIPIGNTADSTSGTENVQDDPGVSSYQKAKKLKDKRICELIWLGYTAQRWENLNVNKDNNWDGLKHTKLFKFRGSKWY